MHELAFLNEEMPFSWQQKIEFVRSHMQQLLEAYDARVLRHYDRREEQLLLASASGKNLEQQVLDLIFEEIGDPKAAAWVFVWGINPGDDNKAAYYAARKAFDGSWYLYRNATATIPDESVIERSAQSATDLYVFLSEIIHQTVKLSSVGKEK